jgi:hypothetical protein
MYVCMYVCMYVTTATATTTTTASTTANYNHHDCNNSNDIDGEDNGFDTSIHLNTQLLNMRNISC